MKKEMRKAFFVSRRRWECGKTTEMALSEYVTKFYLNEEASDNWRF